MDLRGKISEERTADVSVSIIVLTHNKLPLTIDCLNSIVGTVPDGMKVQIIIVDNGSTDGTEKWIEHFYQKFVPVERSPNKNIIVYPIFNSKNLGFAGGCNMGFEIATNDIIVFLNNDTVVTPGWIEELCVALICCPEIALVGPVSNFAGGEQGIEAPYTGRAGMLNFARQNLIDHNRKVKFTGMVTGLCMAGRREVLQELVGFHVPPDQLFDELFFPGMWEDNDLCLRARLKNYQCAVCEGAFVHHEGSATIQQITDGGESDLLKLNQAKFNKKWAAIFPKEHKVVAMLRVKDGIRHIERCLSSLETWVDEIVVLDTGSTDGTREVIEKFLAIKFSGKVEVYDDFTFRDEPLQEYDERQKLLELAQSRNPTWIVRVDVDEAWESKIKDKLPMLLNPINPEILCWQFPMKTFWRGEKRYRVDGNWGMMCPYALFRNIPGAKLQDNKHPQGFHIATVPIFQSRNIGFANVTMLHYGYSDWVEVERKFKWYSDADTDKRQEDIGGRGDYSHLIDESNLKLIEYHPDNKISLSILLKDEFEDLRELIELTYPIVDEIVITYTGVEGGYPPEIGMLRSDFVRIFPFEWMDDFSAARNFGLSQCKGRWILHLDPDERLSPRSLGQITMLAETSALAYIVTVINFLEDPKKVAQPKVHNQDAVRFFRNVPELYYTNPVHETLDDAIRGLPKDYAIVHRSQVLIHHFGYLIDRDILIKKLEKYAVMNTEWAKRSPNDPRPLYNLAMHYLDLDKVDDALDYLERAAALPYEGLWQIKSALAGIYLRAGKNFALKAFEEIPEDHPSRKNMKYIHDFLNGRVGEAPHIIGGKNGNDKIQGQHKAVREDVSKDGGASGDKGDEVCVPPVQEEYQPDGSHPPRPGGDGAPVQDRGESTARAVLVDS